MESLSNKKWKEFFLVDIFEIKSGKRLVKENMRIGSIPFIGASDSNNGITNFISNKNSSTDKNVLGVNYNGSVVENFYHPYLCTFSDDVKRFSTKNVEGNKYIYLFIKNAILQQKQKYMYGYKFNEGRMLKQKIMLPVNSKGEPDYEFMEEYMKGKERNLKDRYKEYIKSNIKELQKKVTENRDWKEFFVAEIFKNIERGKRLTKANQQHGNIPYVSSTAQNNGIDNFISNACNVRKYENCLSLANSGSVGACFYEPFEFIASDHVTALKGEYSKYTYLFIACMLNRLSGKYNFNREINDKRIKREKIYLPITLDGNPDYKYMEDYMKYLEQKKTLQYLDYINRSSPD